jgi:DNA-binding MarR family transcriptional regulator
MRSFGKARAQLLAAAEHDVEWSAHMLLKLIQHEGPMRASALSDCLKQDPSTISRQVAALVKDGLLERRADPDDGRASLLALTPKADAVLADHEKVRLDFFARTLDGWSDQDLRRFATLLRRFTEAHEAAADTWIADRVAQRSGRNWRKN